MATRRRIALLTAALVLITTALLGWPPSSQAGGPSPARPAPTAGAPRSRPLHDGGDRRIHRGVQRAAPRQPALLTVLDQTWTAAGKSASATPAAAAATTTTAAAPGSVYGMVLGPDGAGLAAVAIQLYSADATGTMAAARTGADGQFRCDDVAAGRYWIRACIAAAPRPAGWGAGGPRLIRIAAGGRHRVDLSARPAPCRLAGRVADADGRPVVGVTLVCAPTDAGAPLPRGRVPAAARLGTADSDDDGRFDFGPLPERAVEIRLHPRALRPRHALGPRSLLQGFAPVRVDLAGQRGVVDLGTLRCVRAPICTIAGQLELRTTAIDQVQHPADLQASVALSRAGSRAGDVTSGGRLPQPLALDAHGAFEVRCEVGWTAWIHLDAGDGRVRTRRVVADHEGRLPLRIAFP